MLSIRTFAELFINWFYFFKKGCDLIFMRYKSASRSLIVSWNICWVVSFSSCVSDFELCLWRQSAPVVLKYLLQLEQLCFPLFWSKLQLLTCIVKVNCSAWERVPTPFSIKDTKQTLASNNVYLIKSGYLCYCQDQPRKLDYNNGFVLQLTNTQYR